jgi:hypothetical protein
VTITADYLRGKGAPVIGMRGTPVPVIEDKKSDAAADADEKTASNDKDDESGTWSDFYGDKK